jgi:hypothetical protein
LPIYLFDQDLVCHRMAYSGEHCLFRGGIIDREMQFISDPTDYSSCTKSGRCGCWTKRRNSVSPFCTAGGGFFFARNVAGGSFSGFATDCTVKLDGGRCRVSYASITGI